QMPLGWAHWCCRLPMPSKEKQEYSARRRRTYRWYAVSTQRGESRDGRPESFVAEQNCPPKLGGRTFREAWSLSLWERPARQLNRSWRAGLRVARSASPREAQAR